MDYKILILSVLIIAVLVSSGCVQQTDTLSSLGEENETYVDPVLQRAEPYINEIVFRDVDMRGLASTFVSDCPSGDRECQINKLYRYVVENYNYYGDPRGGEFIQSPYETIEIKGGDCEDLTILLNSLLENLGMKTYLVLTEGHVYSLVCDIDVDNLWEHIQDSIINQFYEDFGQGEDYEIVIENGKIFMVTEKKQKFVIKAMNLFYYGGNGSKLISPTDYMSIKYDVSSSQPLNIIFVPSRNDFELLSEGEKYIHYPSCKRNNILEVTDSCDNLVNYGGVIFQNLNWYDATVDLTLKFYFYYSSYELIKDQKVTSYQIEGKKCIVLDSTAGKYGYPGYDASLVGEKLAVDPMTKEYTYLG